MDIMRRREQRPGPEVGSSDKAILTGTSKGNNCLAPQKREAVAVSNLQDGITLLLSRWNGLQLAIQNQWGGSESLRKSDQLAADVLSWFSQSNAFLSVEDLETLLHESMLLSFNTEIEDGSIEEVAEQLMIMHEEYFQEHHF